MIKILDIQYNLYSCDTGHFYSNHEKYLHNMNCKYRRERNFINNKLPELEKHPWAQFNASNSNVTVGGLEPEFTNLLLSCYII